MSKTMNTVGLSLIVALGLACGGGGGGGESTNTPAPSTTTTTTSTAREPDTTSENFADTRGGSGKIEKNAAGKFVISGTFNGDVTLRADREYLLQGGVFIGNDTDKAVITIQPGTVIRGLQGTPPGMLVIKRGSQILAAGTKEKPIVFTSAQTSPNRGDWGGLVINGRAPINAVGGTAQGEGASGTYGGTDAADNSGVLQYVRVEYAGHVFTSEDELNGIAFQGVGNGTTIDHIQVHMNADDGVEFFGGTANAKYLVITGCGDDSIDWTGGFNGKIQYAVVQQYGDECDQGIEADNLDSSMDATPRSAPVLSNITLIGVPSSTKSDIGILLRHGTAGKIYNSVVYGFNEANVDIDSEATWRSAYSDFSTTKNTLSGALVMRNNFIFNTGSNPNFKGIDEATAFTDTTLVSDFVNVHNTGNQVVDPQIMNPLDEVAPNFLVQNSSPVRGSFFSPSDAFFDTVNYSGAFDNTTDWTAGWARFK